MHLLKIIITSKMDDCKGFRMQQVNNTNKSVTIGKLEVGPGEQKRIALGTFEEAHPPKGFSIAITPDPEEDAIVTKVTTLETGDGNYELVLHVANYGGRVIEAEVMHLT